MQDKKTLEDLDLDSLRAQNFVKLAEGLQKVEGLLSRDEKRKLLSEFGFIEPNSEKEDRF